MGSGRGKRISIHCDQSRVFRISRYLFRKKPLFTLKHPASRDPCATTATRQNYAADHQFGINESTVEPSTKKPVVIVGWLSSPHQQTIPSALQRSFFWLKAIWKMKLSLLLSFKRVVQFLALLHESHFPLIFIRGSGNV